MRMPDEDVSLSIQDVCHPYSFVGNYVPKKTSFNVYKL